MDYSFVDELPSGPLDVYRKQASFNWKKMKFFFEDVEQYKLKLKVWNTLENEPIFRKPDTELTTEEMKRLTSLRFHQYCKYNFLPPDISTRPYKQKTRLVMTVNEALAVVFRDLSVKYAIGISLFTNSLQTLGTERHREVFDAAWDRKILSCIALTEVAHGSNTKQMRTTATYDRERGEFVINTPDFEAAKCWIGNIGKTCTTALLFAQLYTQGQCHGLHAFIVPIRDPKTLLPYPGIIVGDIGEKIGLNGIDNGFLMFQNYRIPRENLLNRTADVTPDGDYESSFKDPGKILGAALENLSTGRVGIMQESAHTLINAVTIAIRYAAVRKQFGPDDTEIPILEYQLHQWRLFPYVAATAVMKTFVDEFADVYLSSIEKTSVSNGTRIDTLSDLVAEIHAVVSACKPLITWTVIHALQECREACGGHGYLKSAHLGDLKTDSEPCVTYEGDNNVLVQQTSNWLIRQWSNVLDNGTLSAPLGSISFLLDHRRILSTRFSAGSMANVTSPLFLKECYEWLIVYLLSVTHEKQNVLVRNGNCKFVARNNTQVYKAAVLSKAYSENLVLNYYWKKVSTNNTELRPVLDKLGLLYGLTCLDKHLTYFYQGGYATGPQMIDFVKEAILGLCTGLKPEIVGVIDALAPPDYVVDSILGKADGKLYQHLQTEFFGNPGAMSRPSWWHEIIIRDRPHIKMLAKL